MKESLPLITRELLCLLNWDYSGLYKLLLSTQVFVLAESNTEIRGGNFHTIYKTNTTCYTSGSHVAHNKETGDNVGPLLIVAAK